MKLGSFTFDRALAIAIFIVGLLILFRSPVASIPFWFGVALAGVAVYEFI